MHHKRGRHRNRRAGCKMCKFWKVNGVATERVNGEKFSDHRRRDSASQDMAARGDRNDDHCGMTFERHCE